jgi:hypothetical protein
MTSLLTKDKYRAFQQFYGAEWRRAQDENYWVKRFTLSYEKNRNVAVVVDDCRFPNEYKALKTLGFKFVRLEPGETTRPLTGEQAAHESEKYWRKFKVDLLLPYVKGPEQQASAILAYFNPVVEESDGEE